jgi:hypothetical protein
MAQDVLKTAKQRVSVAESTTSTLQTLAGIKNTDVYNSMLNALEETIINNLYLANKFKNYKTSSLDAVKYWSSIYESSAEDISTYTGKSKMYSSFYESSMIGASTLLALAAKDRSRIAEQQMNADAIQNTLDRLKLDYDAYMSSYNSYIKTSSFYSDQVANDAFRLSTVSSLYVSTQKGLDLMAKEYSELILNKIKYNASLYSQSSILNRSLINLATYDAQIKNNVNIIEVTSYQYRETYGLVKRINLQSNYESLVLEAMASVGDWTWQSSETIDVLGTKFTFDAQGVHVGDAAQSTYAGSLRWSFIKNGYVKVKYTFFDRYYSSFDPFSLQGANSGRESWKIPSYGIMSIHAGYRVKFERSALNFKGNVFNALNALYISDARNNGHQDGSENFDANSATVFFGQGTTFNVSVGFEF